ncbi:hypothetical protein B0H15DRAFT_831164 [Mycena belliarum]|uniref:RING-type domain-containing protein n=1 Tax=Mycena belliarum TaxID=1033014 RepID=A0AAD6UAB6_9AGAR|nr:hypothetical protein B0H15DRAFT_831164 [Mycena belliae]
MSATTLDMLLFLFGSFLLCITATDPSHRVRNTRTFIDESRSVLAIAVGVVSESLASAREWLVYFLSTLANAHWLVLANLFAVELLIGVIISPTFHSFCSTVGKFTWWGVLSHGVRNGTPPVLHFLRGRSFDVKLIAANFLLAATYRFIRPLRRNIAATPPIAAPDEQALVGLLTESLQKLDDLRGKLETELECSTCTKVMVYPYTLSPCGHHSCLGCLTAWFSVDPQGTGLLPINRPKRCPCCNARVYDRPTEARTLKDVISVLRPGHHSLARIQDPWAGIFA